MDNQDQNIYQLELMPKSMKSKYSKIIVYLDRENRYPIKMEYFDDNKEFFKYATYDYVKQGKYWYAKEVVMADFEEAGDEDVFRKVRGDFDAAGVSISDEDIRKKMKELLAEAVDQIQSE